MCFTASVVERIFAVTLVFFLVRLAPGGPFDSEKGMSPEVRANLEAAYGLDRPLAQQYFTYVASLLHGDFGPSFRFKDHSVTELIAAGLPNEVSAMTINRFCASGVQR